MNHGRDSAVTSCRVSLPAWAEDWINTKAAQGLAPLSLQRYAEDLRILGLDLRKCTAHQIRSRLGECSRHYSLAVLRHLTVLAKMVLKDLNREKEAKALKLPKRPEPRVVVYEKTDIDKILLGLNRNQSRKDTGLDVRPRDRLLIRVLYETGARSGELCNMRIKDVQFDEHSAIIWLHGKTGTRRRRLYNAESLIHEYLQNHPHRDDPEAAFWINQYGQPLNGNSMYKAVRRIGYRTLNRPIFPHAFRHSRATIDAQHFTDQEMKVLYGWKRAEMVEVYAHVSARDVDAKDIALHEHQTRFRRICSSCKGENSEIAVYCQNCGRRLEAYGDAGMVKMITEVNRK